MLGWPPDAALGADVNIINMALNARYEADEALYRVMYVCAGIKVPDTRPRTPISAAGLKAWAAQHNARMARRGKAATAVDLSWRPPGGKKPEPR